VSRFLDDAAGIFDVAQSAANNGAGSGITILVGVEGGIRMLADSDWPLASLVAHHGASAAYRVHHTQGTVTVDGRSGGRTCRLAGEQPAAIARHLLQREHPGLGMLQLLVADVRRA
jgi:hypothetical protein